MRVRFAPLTAVLALAACLSLWPAADARAQNCAPFTDVAASDRETGSTANSRSSRMAMLTGCDLADAPGLIKDGPMPAL